MVLPKLMLILFGDSYEPSIVYAQVLLASIAISVFHNLKFRYVMSQLDSDSFRGYSIYTSLARITFSVMLIPFFGVWGAIASTVLYRVISVLYIEIIMRKKYR